MLKNRKDLCNPKNCCTFAADLRNKTMNTNKRIIKGHYDLELVVGNLYDIHYGVNQGVYEYMGQETEGFWENASIFRNVDNGKYFNYFGTSSPYEFTNIVKPYKHYEKGVY